ncbi:phosphatase PAP2 family protein [Bifidobacterium olomucense]|uniref:Phosphoesterase n=1 Tax=Bifidobacterium olomucense TaxID=2675324 RepID=A0A7Y0EY47_9BIFI|nr:phosphatase PAP2 family protein [Bifidobacterium sp. DSM 109959]NMM98558.1 phosphoesterase [Bifidobacterium sp. DSM 109959]
MNDAPQPTIRDPHKPAGLVGDGAIPKPPTPPSAQRHTNQSSDPIDPLAALGPDRSTASIHANGPRVWGIDKAPSTTASDVIDPSATSAVTTAELDRGLARLDPLTVRPRISSRVLCVVFGLLFIAAAFGVWWGCVCTAAGQSYDEMVYSALADRVAAWNQALVGAVVTDSARHSMLVIGVSVLLGGIGVVAALVRRRWWLIGQLAVLAVLCLAATRLKGLLPRPFLINTSSSPSNSAPSGHTMLAAAAAVILLLAVPRAARAVAAVVGATWSVMVAVSVIVGGWHRPSDVVMSILLVAGLALLAMAFTRTSGMDAPGQRVSSVSVQILGSVMITAGLLLLVYAAYLIWQVVPGLGISASWAVDGAVISALTGICGVAALAFGLVLALRQITAAPLSRLGLIGAPPAPPQR